MLYCHITLEELNSDMIPLKKQYEYYKILILISGVTIRVAEAQEGQIESRTGPFELEVTPSIQMKNMTIYLKGLY
jgi:hypothetical protein